MNGDPVGLSPAGRVVRALRGPSAAPASRCPSRLRGAPRGGVAALHRLSGPEAARLRARNDRIVLLTLAIFVAFLALLALEHGFALSPDVVAVAGALLLVLVVRNRPSLREWSAFLVLGLAYELIRGDTGALLATLHVGDMAALERTLFAGYLPAQVLQAWLHPRHGLDVVAAVATILYILHTALPVVVGAFLWVRDRAGYYDYLAALVVLSMAAFVTYLILPVAPPWWAAAHGFLNGASGQPELAYLQPGAFDSLAASAGLDGHVLFGLTFGEISPDQIASFPSLHAAYPFLAYLVARRVLGRARWAVLAYAAAVWFAVVYLGDHYVVDVIAGFVYTLLAYGCVVGPERWAARRALVPRLAEVPLEAGAMARSRA
jgi:hypothetical protein